MDSTPKRRWYRLHSLTCFVIVVVLGGLAYREMQERWGLGARGPGPGNPYTDWTYFGWPWAHLEKVESGTYVLPSTLIPQSTDYRWRWESLGANLLLCLLILGATCIACESWLRCRHRLQFNLGQLVIVIAVVAVLLGWLVNIDPPTLDGEVPTNDEGEPIDWVHSALLSWGDFQHPLHWPVVAGIACTIYAVVWLARGATLYIWTILRRRSG